MKSYVSIHVHHALSKFIFHFVRYSSFSAKQTANRSVTKRCPLTARGLGMASKRKLDEDCSIIDDDNDPDPLSRKPTN